MMSVRCFTLLLQGNKQVSVYRIQFSIANWPVADGLRLENGMSRMR